MTTLRVRISNLPSMPIVELAKHLRELGDPREKLALVVAIPPHQREKLRDQLA